MIQNLLGQLTSKCLIGLFTLILGVSVLLPSVNTYAATGGGGSASVDSGAGGYITYVPGIDTSPTHWYSIQGDSGIVDYDIPADGSSLQNYAFEVTYPTKRVEFIPNTSTENVQYWYQFYDSSGNRIGTTPSTRGQQAVALPNNTRYVMMLSYDRLTGRSRTLSSLGGSDGSTEFIFGNIWALEPYVSVDGKTQNYRNCCNTIYPYKASAGDVIELTYNRVYLSSAVMLKVQGYSASGQKTENYTSGGISSSGGTNRITLSNSLTTDVYVTIYHLDSNGTLAGVIGACTLTISDGTTVYENVNVPNNTYYPYSDSPGYDSNSYDNSVNNNWTAGDGSTVIIVDGDGNNIEVLNPRSDVSTVDNTQQDNNTGSGFWERIGNGIADFISGIGSIIGGIIAGIVEGLSAIVTNLSSVITTLNGAVSSVGGLLEGLFTFLPSPLPEMLIGFIGITIFFALIRFIK